MSEVPHLIERQLQKTPHLVGMGMFSLLGRVFCSRLTNNSQGVQVLDLIDEEAHLP